MQKPGLFGMNGFMVFLLTFFSIAARAQHQDNLILIDAENKQAFSVRVGEELFASSGHGHLVLSHLKDSAYRLNIRFPKRNLDEQVFPVQVRGKDMGFQLKGADSSWILYNWQTKETIRPVFERDSSRILDRGVKRDDGFSRLMASVVNDTAVMYNTYTGNGFQIQAQGPSEIPASKPKVENLAHISASTKDTIITANGQRPTANEIPSTVSHQPTTLPPSTVNRQPLTSRDSLLAIRKAYKDSLVAVRKAIKDSIATAKRQAYSADSLARVSRKASRDSLLALRKPKIKDSATANGQPPTANDTASTANRQLPTANNHAAATNGQRPMASEIPSTVNHPPSAFPPQVKKLREVSLKVSRKIVYLDRGRDGITDTVTLFVYFETADSSRNKSAPAPAMTVKKTAVTDTTGLNNASARIKYAETGCNQVATDADLEFLRSAILKANTEQEKISVATGAFSMKCFSVSQVRMLASLLVSDKAKYRLMDAARLHIADRDHFRELADMYTDKNFQRKFLVLADKRS